MRYCRHLLFLLLLPSIQACKKVVSVDLNNASPRIVIEGELTDIKQSCRVRISKTVNFYDDNVFPPVSGATVSITDTTRHKTYVLSEMEPGLYTNVELTGIANHTYVMDVKAEGNSYTAFSTMPRSVPLDSITFAINTDFNNKKDINAVVNFQDPAGIVNYYRFIEYRNGKMIPNTFVFEDRLSDGRYIEQPLFNDSTYLHKGDTLLLKMYCVDKSDYSYFFSLLQATATGNGYQSATPANPVTNISNGALGYFSAHTSVQTEMLVY